MSLRDWLVEMTHVARAKIALANLLSDVAHQRVPRQLVRQFLAYVDCNWAPGGGRSAERMIRVFAREDPSNRYCQGRPASTKPADGCCSRIIDAKTLWEWNIDYSHGGFVLDDEVPDREIERIEQNGLKGIAKGHMTGGEPFAWVTVTGQLDHLRSEVAKNGNDFAAEVRDQLGLDSYLKQEKLVEVRYPPAVVATMKLAPPTFVEGSPGMIFRSTKTNDGWGRTMNLKTHEQSLPEAVHTPVPFTDEFAVRRVGRPQRTDFAFDWQEVADNLIHDDSQAMHLETLLREPEEADA